MIYSELISQIRSQVGDTKKFSHVDFTADGSSNVFQMPAETFPVYDDATTYTVKVAGLSKTETTDYVLDKNTGTLTFTSTPTNGQAVTVDCYTVHITNSDWISIINSVIRSLGDDFFKEFTDDSTYTSTANMLSLSLVASIPKCIALYDLQYRRSTVENWINVSDICNWRYDRENNVIFFGNRNAFTSSGLPIRMRGLKTYTLGAAVADTVDVQDKFLTIIEYGCVARYWRWRYKSVVELVSKMTTESTRTPLQELIMLADRFDRLYEMEKGKLKPQKPARIVPQFLIGGGTP